jgi:hypothetical protein
VAEVPFLKSVVLKSTFLCTPETLKKRPWGAKGFFLLAIIAACTSVYPIVATAQTYGTSSHSVTVNVQPVTVLQINVGILNLNISGANAIAGQNQMTVTDQSTTLLWGTNSSLKKITANTSLATSLFQLKIVALSPTTGTAAPEITLSPVAADLLLNIGRSSGSCQLRYTGIALASQGTGTDSHTITFTVQTQ